MRRQRADTSEEVGLLFCLQCFVFVCVCVSRPDESDGKHNFIICSAKCVCSSFIVLLVKVVTLRRSSGRGPSIWKNAKLLLHLTSFSKRCVWLCYFG